MYIYIYIPIYTPSVEIFSKRMPTDISFPYLSTWADTPWRVPLDRVRPLDAHRVTPRANRVVPILVTALRKRRNMDDLGWRSARPLTLQSLIDCHLGVCGAKRGCYDTSTVLRKRAERNEANSTLPHDLRNATPFPCVSSVSSHLFYQLVVLPS